MDEHVNIRIEARSIVRDTPFPFKYVRPRIAAGFSIFLAIFMVYISVFPDFFFKKSYHGQYAFIDEALRSLSPQGKSFALFALGLYFLYVLTRYYLPCIFNGSLIIFDGRYVNGFDKLGRLKRILRSEIQSVVFRHGTVTAKGRDGSVWIPLSLMKLDQAQDHAIRSLLRDAGA